MLSISELEPGEETRWDGFASEAPDATFFHLSGWKSVIEQAFGHRCFYLVARENGQIRGILPLTHLRSLFFGNSLISNAFCVQGGPIADNGETAEALRDHAVALAYSLKVKSVEFRSASNTTQWTVRSNRYAIFRREIDCDDTKNLKAIPRKQRAVVRKAIDSRLKSEIDDDVNRLHHIYAESVRRLGTPVFAMRYFKLLKEKFGDSCEILTVTSGSEALAAVMSFYFRDQILPYYGGGLERARKAGANDFLYWEVMKRASKRGVRIFDFGRSKIGTGSYQFKHNWGFEPTPLHYEYLALRNGEIPDISPLNPKYGVAVNIWRHLPLSVTKLVGPAIVRCIG